jgi:ABC-type nitrate/sulfonate/bicarbonate transport system substrate-binding protein
MRTNRHDTPGTESGALRMPALAPPRPRRRENPGIRRSAPVLTLAGLVVAGLVLAACGGASSSQGGHATSGLQNFRIALDYTANVNYLGIYAAIANGYFRDEGIEPDIIPYANTPAETLLSAGKTDLGLTYPPSIPAARAGGLDYEAVAGLTQRNTIAIAVLASSPYRSVAQLNGTLYGGFGVASDEPIIDAVLRDAGVRDPRYREIDLGVDAYQALAAHRVTYSIVFGGIDDVTAELSGVALREFFIRRYLGAAASFPDDAFVAMDKAVAADPGLYRHALAALARGYEFAAAHPAAAEAILVGDNRTALAHAGNIVAATGKATAPTFVDSAGVWGRMDDADFAGLTSILVDGGLIPRAEAPTPAEDFTDALLPSTVSSR